MTIAAGPLFVLAHQTNVDATGVPTPGALLYFYYTGTDDPADVYSNALLTTPFTQPVEADSEGVFPVIYMQADVSYKVKLTDSLDAEIWTADPANFIWSYANLNPAGARYPVSMTWNGGSPPAVQTLAAYPFVVDVTFPGDYDGAYGWCLPSALPGTQYDIALTNQNGDDMGTISVATDGTFTFSTPASAPAEFSAGDTLIFTAPNAATAMTDFAATILGTVA